MRRGAQPKCNVVEFRLQSAGAVSAAVIYARVFEVAHCPRVFEVAHYVRVSRVAHYVRVSGVAHYVRVSRVAHIQWPFCIRCHRSGVLPVRSLQHCIA